MARRRQRPGCLPLRPHRCLPALPAVDRAGGMGAGRSSPRLHRRRRHAGIAAAGNAGNRRTAGQRRQSRRPARHLVAGRPLRPDPAALTAIAGFPAPLWPRSAGQCRRLPRFRRSPAGWRSGKPQRWPFGPRTWRGNPRLVRQRRLYPGRRRRSEGQCRSPARAGPLARYGPRTGRDAHGDGRARRIGDDRRGGHRSQCQGGPAGRCPRDRLCHPRPAGGRSRRFQRAGTGVHSARRSQRPRRRPADHVGNLDPATQRRMGDPVGLQHGGRRWCGCSRAVRPGEGLLPGRRAKPARIALAGARRRGCRTDRAHHRHSAGKSRTVAGGGIAARHARDPQRSACR